MGAVKGNQLARFSPQSWFSRYHCTWIFSPMKQILTTGLEEDCEKQQREFEVME